MAGRTAWLWVTVVAMFGCFTEATGPTGACRAGSAGCPCAKNGCDAGLSCASEVDLCIPQNCSPGEELCTCHDGDCFGDLRCDGELCRPDGATSGDASVGSSMATSSADSIAEGSDAGPTSSLDSGETTSASTTATSITGITSDSTDPTDATAETGMPMTDTRGDTGVDGGPCHDCILMADDMGGACEMSLAGCGSDCFDLAICVTGCLDADDPSCIAPCCGAHPSGAIAYGDLATCWASSCAAECGEFMLSCG